MLSPELNVMLTKKSDIEERIIALKAERKAIIGFYILRAGLCIPVLGVSWLFTVVSGNTGIIFFGIVCCMTWMSMVYVGADEVHGELLDNIEAMSRNKGLLKKVENQIEDWVTR